MPEAARCFRSATIPPRISLIKRGDPDESESFRFQYRPRRASRGSVVFPHRGGGGGGHSLRFLTVLAGFTAFLAVPHSAVAVNECGATSPVTCGDASYASTSDSPIKYQDKTGGLTLTVKPSGAGTVTITAEALPTSASDAFPGIHLNGHGTLKVLLDGAVKVVNGATRTTVDATLAGETGTFKFIHPDHKLGSRNDGVYVAYDKDDDAGTTTGMVEVMVGKDAVIGSETAPAGRYGVHAAFVDGDSANANYPAGKIKVTNAGMVHGHYAGIYAKHDGKGDIEIETLEGSVTSMGIRAISNKADKADRGGNIAIRHHGRIVVKDPARYADTLTMANVATPLEMDKVSFSDRHRGGIYVEHWEKRTPTGAKPSSSILVESSGDIVAHPIHGKEGDNRARRSAIYVITRGNGDSVVPVTVDVTGGTLTADDPSGRNGGNGIYIYYSQHKGGLIKVDLAGEISRTGDIRDGIFIERQYDDDSDDSSDVSRDIEVTLKSGARIGMEGDEPTVGRRGVSVTQSTSGGTVRVAVESGARIGTAGTPVGENGVVAEISNADDENDIMVTNEGHIHAKGSGVVALHRGWGAVVVQHLAGEIVAGDQPNAFSSLIEDHQTELADLKSRTAGVSAIHGGSEPKPLPGKNIIISDPSTYESDIGEIKITSKADVTSKGDGILAYVKDLDDVGARSPKVRVPITIDVAGGTITADGHGVYAETATIYQGTYANTEITYDDATKAGKIEVTVGEMATIRAKKDGVHVKGMRTFASDHARKGQYDQTVTINGKVMGGGGDHAGVRMVNGGTLVIGPKAEIGATSGTAVSADKALHVTLKENAHGQIAFVMGKFLNSGKDAPNVFQRELMAGAKKMIAVGDAVKATSGKTGTHGVYDAVFERMVTLKSIAGGHQFQVDSEKEISRTYHARARVYEALPSVLLEMSAPGGRQARLSATRDGGGAWARVLASDGEREVETSTTEMDDAGRALSWDFERWGVETGFVVPTDAPGLMLGVSAHYRDGEADVARGGKIEVSGVGVGASATWRGEDGWYADGELSYTRFEDVDLSSETRGMVASGLDGDGHAISVEVGRRMDMDGFALVPRGGLTWTWVDVDGFDDVSGVIGSGRASFRSEDSVRARVGALLENGQTYASLDVEREFSESREVMASGSRLRSEAESTWARVGVGGVMVLDDKGESTLSGDAHYAASDGDNHDYGASVLLKVRF